MVTGIPPLFHRTRDRKHSNDTYGISAVCLARLQSVQQSAFGDLTPRQFIEQFESQ